MEKEQIYSRVIAGTMTWGRWGKQFNQAEISGLVKYCYELGITTFDHADIYGDYTTEEDFGRGFKGSGVDRSSVQFISKCGIQFKTDTRPNRVKHYDYSKNHIIASVERSLKNLKTDYLDMLLLHRPSPLLHPEEVAEAVTKLSRQGKIKQFGVSNFKPSQIKVLETAIPVKSNQVEYSLTSNEMMYKGVLDDCLAHDRCAMSWSPLGSYFRVDDDQVLRIKKLMTNLTEKYNATADQLLLAWVMKHPSKVYPVVGTTTKERLKAAIEAIKIELELQDWFLLLEASKGNEVP
jgi:predicted oxidoreductase